FSLLGRGCWSHAHETAAGTFVRKVHDACHLGVEGVVAADADVDAGVELRAALANENRAAGDELPGEALHAEHFRLRVAAVARRTLSFFVSHCLPLDRINAKLDHVLPMPVRPFRVILSALLPEHNDLVAARFPENGGRNRGTVDRR